MSTSSVIPSVPVLDTPGSGDVPPPTPDGFYRPTPLCETEEIIGEVLGGTINTIMSGFDSAIGPVIDEIQNSLGGSSTETGSENSGTIDNAINENNVLASLIIWRFSLKHISNSSRSSWDLILIVCGGCKSFLGRWKLWIVDYFQFIDAVGQNTPDNQTLIAECIIIN